MRDLLAPRALCAIWACAIGCAAESGTVGAVFAQSRTNGTVRVREVPPGLPASIAGLQSDDELLLVDGYDVRALSPEQLHARLAGPPGSNVRLTVLRAGEIRRLVVPRAALGDRARPAP